MWLKRGSMRVLALMAVLLWLDARRKVPRGKLFAVYVLGYGVGRLWVESLRIDKASKILGARVNIWVSLIAIVGGLAWLAFGRARAEEPAFAAAAPADDVDAEVPDEAEDRSPPAG